MAWTCSAFRTFMANLSIGVYNRPFMIGNCQGQTELSSPLLPTEPLVAHASLIGAPCSAISEAYLYFCSSFFGPEFLHRLGSTAKRDQSFICTYPALGEGFYGRLSLGNPPALKQSVQVYREASLRCTGRLRQGPAGTRVSRIETVMPSILTLREHRSLCSQSV